MKKYFLHLLLFTASVLLLVGLIITARAADQFKTSEFFVASFDSQISSATSSQFSFYIGDNLSGISNPVKSAYFTVSGVYTSAAGGTLELKIDNDSATSKTFDLPIVSAPTFFEFIYKDNSNKINPASAGSYTHTLNINPTGIIVSGFGAKFVETHKYVSPSCPDGPSANEKFKTSEFFVASINTQLSLSTSTQFSIYIGDNISTVTNPIKSAYFVATGLYTGNGSLEFQINGDVATSKIFSLPDVVATPTPFEIIYKDNSNKINPTTAGSYNYTFNIIPTGITISGFGAKFIETHRYKPPTCGGTYPATGEIISPTFDTGAANGVSYNWLMASGTTPFGTKIRVQLATSATSTGPWTYLGPNCDIASYYYDGSLPTLPQLEIKCFSDHNNKRYFRYKVILCSGDCSIGGSYTPQIDNVIVNWSL